MTIGLAIEYIRKRMIELGHADKYFLRYRHFVLTSKKQIEINAETHIYILCEPNDAVIVESNFGIFDVTEDFINELQYEHQGKISITNYSTQLQHVRFIQVIPALYAAN